ncbi:MAG: hypothetical protein AAB455_02585 [Patescibacteria group bacterium]
MNSEKTVPQTGRKIGFVSAACAAIGVLLAWGARLQFDLGLWIVFIGGLASGSLAWLMYDFAGVITGVKQAWREAWASVKGWKPTKNRIRRFIYAFVALQGIWFWFLVFFVIVMSPNHDFHYNDDKAIPAALIVSLASLLFPFITMLAYKSYASDKRSALTGNLVVLPFTITYLFFRGIIWLVRRAPRRIVIATKFIKRLGVRSFILIHSEERRICFTAATIGTAIGLITCYQHGNAFIGALIGALVGGALGHVEYRFGKQWAVKLAAKFPKKEVDLELEPLDPFPYI